MLKRWTHRFFPQGSYHLALLALGHCVVDMHSGALPVGAAFLPAPDSHAGRREFVTTALLHPGGLLTEGFSQEKIVPAGSF
ncbi:MAG TPA: hypothetical protein VK101_05570 [Limnochordia bacterium]|nr:hypothetical protein [Limnochordia bacterium]